MMDTEGFDDLRIQIAAMASALDTEGAGSSVTRIILENAAVPVHEQMKQNTSKDPQIISGALHGAINIGRVRKRSQGGKYITIGVHRKDWSEEDYYPAYVEYGHGGPGPAPSHAVLPFPISMQWFQMICGWDFQILQTSCIVNHNQFT